MKKTSIKEKEPIALRVKELAGGRKSLYLDFYQKGDKNHAHRYEFLKLYLLPETTKENRIQNKETLKIAKAIKTQRLLEQMHGKTNNKTVLKRAFTLVDYMQYFADLKRKYGQSGERARAVEHVIKHIKTFNGTILLTDVDKNFCIEFIKYLSSAKGFVNKKTLSKSTAEMYYTVLVAVLNQAVREDLITINPTTKVNTEERKAITPSGCKVTYLTFDEVNRLIDTKCGNESVKNAFLFACYTGLRFSDIISLKWSDIKTENNQMFIFKEMIKTRQNVIVPIGKKALKYLPSKTKTNVFNLPTRYSVNRILKIWAENAKIGKKLHFHISRHTFATSLLTKGADLYSVSKLLGHTDISTTQIYAEIINAKRVEIINLLDDNPPKKKSIRKRKERES